MRELFEAIPCIDVVLNSGLVDIPYFSKGFTHLLLSYLRMKIAFVLQDRELLASSFAMHSGMMAMTLTQRGITNTLLSTVGISEAESERYITIAKNLQAKCKSDLVKMYIGIADSIRGLYRNIPLAITASAEAVALARYYQDHTLLRLSMQMRTMACINIGDFRSAFSTVQDFYFSAVDEKVFTELSRAAIYRESATQTGETKCDGRSRFELDNAFIHIFIPRTPTPLSTLPRQGMSILNTLNRPLKAIATYEFLVNFNDHVNASHDEGSYAVAKSMAAPSLCLAYERSGRIEDASETLKLALNYGVQYVSVVP